MAFEPVAEGAELVAVWEGAAPGAAAEGCSAFASADLPNIADMMLPKMLIVLLLG